MAFSICFARCSEAFAFPVAYCLIKEGLIPAFSAIAEIFIGKSLKNEGMSKLYSNSFKFFQILNFLQPIFIEFLGNFQIIFISLF